MGSPAAATFANADMTLNNATWNIGLDANSDTNNAGTTFYAKSLSGSGYVVSDSRANGLTIGANNGSGSFSGVIGNGTGTLSLVKIGTGTETLTGANTYSGGTTVGKGALVLNFAAAVAPASNILLSTGAVAISGGTLDVAGGSSGTPSQNLGALTANGGELAVTNSGAATTVTAASFARGTGGTLFVDLSQSGGGSNTLTFTSTSGISPSSTGLIPYMTVKTGAGSGFAALSGHNLTLFSGPTTVLTATSNTSTVDYTTNPATDPGYSGGTLQLTGVAGATNSLAINAASSGVLDLGGNTMSFASGGLLMTGSGAYTIQNGQIGASGAELIVNNLGSGVLTLSGSVGGGAGSLTVGGGAVALTGANSYTGGTNISGGLVNINADAALGGSSGTVNFAGNGTLQAGANNIALVSTRPLTIASGATGTIDTQSNTMTINGIISGGGGLAKAGSGLLTLTNANTYGGPTTVNGGTLQVGNGGSTGSLASTVFMVSPNATLAYNVSSGYTATPMAVAGNLSYTSTGILGLNGTYSGNQITALSTNSRVSLNGNLVINAGPGGANITSLSEWGIYAAGPRNITTNGNVTFAGTSTIGSYYGGVENGGVYTATGGTLTFDGTAAPSGGYGIEDGVSGSYAAGISTYGFVVFKGTGGTTRNWDINIGTLYGNGTVTVIGRLKGLNSAGNFEAAGGLPYNVNLQTSAGVGINGELNSGTDTTGGGTYTVSAGGNTYLNSRTINTSGGNISMASSGVLSLTTATLNAGGGNISLASTGAMTLAGGTLNAGTARSA